MVAAVFSVPVLNSYQHVRLRQAARGTAEHGSAAVGRCMFQVELSAVQPTAQAVGALLRAAQQCGVRVCLGLALLRPGARTQGRMAAVAYIKSAFSSFCTFQRLNCKARVD